MTPTPAWATPARVLADFVARTNHLPLQSGSDDEVEKKAGNILRRFRRMESQNELDADLRVWLNANVPGWLTDNVRPTARGMRGRRRFADKAAAAARYRARHGRLPSPTGALPRERELGVFLRNCRQAANGKGTMSWTDAKQRLLDRVVSDWRQATTPVRFASPRAGSELLVAAL